jgi:hypothetical protein
LSPGRLLSRKEARTTRRSPFPCKCLLLSTVSGSWIRKGTVAETVSDLYIGILLGISVMAPTRLSVKIATFFGEQSLVNAPNFSRS